MPSSTPAPSTTSTTTSPNTHLIPPESLETDLLSHLSGSTGLEDLHTMLLCSLQRMGWTEKIRKLTIELLRAGRCERFDDVVEAVVASAEGRKHTALMNRAVDSETDAYFESVDVRIPRVVVDQGVKALKEILGEIVVLDEEGETEERDEGTAGGVAVKKEEVDEDEGVVGETSSATTSAGGGSPVKKKGKSTAK